MPWGFYGRTDELRMTAKIIGRNRWFFAKMTGRRRIGKTTLIQHAIQSAGEEPILYVQTPDSTPAGVLSAVDDALESFGVSIDRFPGQERWRSSRGWGNPTWMHTAAVPRLAGRDTLPWQGWPAVIS